MREERGQIFIIDKREILSYKKPWPDLLRVDLLPQCYMAQADMRELRRVLRYRNFIVRMATTVKNKMSGLLMEVGAEKKMKGSNL